MADSDPDGLLAVHALRLKGFAEADVLAAVFGLDPASVEHTLTALSAAGHAKHRSGRRAGWTLTQPGTEAHRRRIVDDLDLAGGRDRLLTAYRRFLPINARLLELCTDWQLRTVDDQRIVNDHADIQYDRGVLDRLDHFHIEATSLLALATEASDRFHHHQRRLDVAIARIRAGDHRWFDRPDVDSYHTVWFELHEDFLVSLGLHRSEERSA